ncbi:MAG TPA: response regulator transcription factor [Parafilimonas sp.]|nr:response regulator transcription factor [Parafilimonas sp.]
MNHSYLPYSYMSYLDITAKESSHDLLANPGALIKNVFGEINLNSPISPIIFLTDFTQKGYVFVHKGCTSIIGYSAKYLIDGGLDAFLEKLYEPDFKIINEEIFKKNVEILHDIRNEATFDYIFCHSYRLKHKDGKYITLLQRVLYLVSGQNNPVGAIGYVSDVSMFNNDQTVHRVEHINNTQAGRQREIVFQNYFYHNPEHKTISKRELEVLKWITEGFSSKQIADRLNISPNTVNNHRRKMLQKTNSKNTAELLHYAVKERLL